MNTIGRIFRVSIFGESHGQAVGVVIDGVAAGVPLSVIDFEQDMNRRRSGLHGTTARKEADIPEIVSGVYDGMTTGAPLVIMIRNANANPDDYEDFEAMPRPGHADYTGFMRFDGFNDPRGGGHFSGRLTAALVAAGVVAKKFLSCVSGSDEPQINFNAKLIAVGGEKNQASWDRIISEAEAEGDSVGGLVECRIENVPAGYGNPYFDSIESLISHIVFAIPGVRGVEFGDGFAAAAMRGSEHNDPIISSDGKTAKNGCGGVNGGITNGNPIVFRVAFKPTSTIHKAQETFDFENGKMGVLRAKGRHDVCFALRTPVIVEAVAAIVIADLCSM